MEKKVFPVRPFRFVSLFAVLAFILFLIPDIVEDHFSFPQSLGPPALIALFFMLAGFSPSLRNFVVVADEKGISFLDGGKIRTFGGLIPKGAAWTDIVKTRNLIVMVHIECKDASKGIFFPGYWGLKNGMELKKIIEERVGTLDQ